MDSSGSAGAQWEEPEFEFDDIGIDLAAAARHSSGKVTEHVSVQGRLHNGGNGARCTMAKMGEDFVMIMMLLLVSIILYYYMNTFITLHQCTFNLLFALFFYIDLPIVVARQLCITS